MSENHEESAHPIGPARPGKPTSRAITSSIIGNVLEWYDFYVYGAASALVLGKQFFPSLDPFAGTLAAFVTYGIGFALRPIGGVVLGRLGDRIGRRRVMIISLTSMGLATGGIGLLPGYVAIGIWAPILLVLLRLIQSVGASAEFGSAVTLVSEYAPRWRRGLVASLPGMGVSLGTLAGTGMFTLVSLLPADQFRTWGWRVPFLVGFSLVAVGSYIRSRVAESPEFARVLDRNEVLRAPVAHLWSRQRGRLLVAAGARSADAVGGQLFNVFAVSYLTVHLKLPVAVGLIGVTLATATGLVVFPLAGALSDRFGRRPVYLAGLVFLALFAFPFFWLVDTRSTGLILTALVLGQGAVWMIFGVSGAYFAELFDPRSRNSGIVLARSVTDPLAGATPLIGTAMLASMGSSWPVSAFLAAFVLLAIVSVYKGPETRQAGPLASPADTAAEAPTAPDWRQR